MGIKVAFNDLIGPYGSKMESSAEMMGFLRSKELYWNQVKELRRKPIQLSEIMNDLGYSMKDLRKLDPEFASEIDGVGWGVEDDDHIDFGLASKINTEALDRDLRHILLEFNCDFKHEKKRCYFWKVFKYHVDANQISLKGWVDWCNELYKIQHGKPRPKNKIFVDPDMTVATVKGRIWNKDQIEKWLNDHGYSWTMTVETKYQWEVTDPDSVILIDSDAEVEARKQKTA